MKIITLASTKGGVGKTTNAIFLAHALAHRGIKTLVVDLDPSNALTDFFLRETPTEQIEARSVLKGLTADLPLEECVFNTELSLAVIGSTPELMTFPDRLSRDPAALMRFSSRLRRLDFEAVVIDTPPALGPLLTIGLIAADLILAPVSPHRWILQAFALLSREVQNVAEIKGRVPEFLSLFSIVNAGELGRLRLLGQLSCSTAIMRSEPVRRAIDMGKPLGARGTQFETFLALSHEVYQ